jgi:predicted phage baseplate assembly protein
VSLGGRATGGADAETVDEATARLRRDLDAPRRAVSLDDYRRLARQTPGVRVERATALVGRGTNATGRAEHDEVRVVVVPHSPHVEPRPSEGLLDAVRRHLARHRLLTDRVRVEAPTFVGIGVGATVGIAPGYDERGRVAAVEAALDAFLDPRGTADDDGGWPFGRPVYRSELYAAIEAVEGVDVAFDVSIDADRASDRDADGNVLLDDAALPSPRRHRVVVERRSSEGGP